MRSFNFSEITPEDCKKITTHFTECGLQSSINQLFWFPVADEFLTAVQKEHKNSCGPYVMALEVNKTDLQLELLVRSHATMQCTCFCWASPELQLHMQNYLLNALQEIGITV